MDVRVLFFARSRELTGTSEATVTLQPGSTTITLMQQLLQQVTEGCQRRAVYAWCAARCGPRLSTFDSLVWSCSLPSWPLCIANKTPFT